MNASNNDYRVLVTTCLLLFTMCYSCVTAFLLLSKWLADGSNTSTIVTNSMVTSTNKY